MEMYFVAILDIELVNYLFLLTDSPMRLKNTTNIKETIYYSYKESEILKKLHPEIEIVPKYIDIPEYLKLLKQNKNGKN